MRQTTLTQSGAPGCVIGCSNSSEQHTFVNNYHRFCSTLLILLDMSFSLSLHFLPVLSLQTSVCSTLSFILFSWCHNQYKIVFSIYITNRGKARVMLQIGAGRSDNCQIILKFLGYDIFCNNLQEKKFKRIWMYQR